MMTAKERKELREKFFKEFDISTDSSKDAGVGVFIAHHYISLGERVIQTITEEDIKKAYQDEVKKQKEAEEKGLVYMIEPDFTKFVLTACVALYKLPAEVKYDIIKRLV